MFNGFPPTSRHILTLWFVVLLSCTSPCMSHIGTGLAIDGDGRVYFVDAARESVWQIDTDGDVKHIANTIHTNVIGIHADGNVMAATGPLIKVASDGLSKTILPESVVDEMNSILLAIDQSGGLYALRNNQLHYASPDSTDRPVQSVADQTFSNRAVGVCQPDGSLVLLDQANLWFISNSHEPVHRTIDAASFERPVNIDITPDGTAYIVDYGNKHVYKYESADKLTRIYSSSFMWFPTAVGEHNGRVYVLERLGDYFNFPPVPGFLWDVVGAPRVRLILDDGSFVTVASIHSSRARILATIVGILFFLALIGGWRAVRARRRARINPSSLVPGP